MCLRRMRGQRRPRSDCADAQSDQGLRCPMPELLDTIRAVSEDTDQTARMRSLIRAFAVPCQNYWKLYIVSMERKGADKSLHVHKLICICTFCACPKALFARPI